MKEQVSSSSSSLRYLSHQKSVILWLKIWIFYPIRGSKFIVVGPGKLETSYRWMKVKSYLPV